MRGCADFRTGCFHDDRKKRYTIFLDADRVHAFVITAGDSATNFVTPELRFFRNFPFRFPASVG